MIDLRSSYVIRKDVKVTVVGDMHLHSTGFSSRVDDYPNTALDKLDILRNTMKENESTVLICLGDIFHKPNQPSHYVYACLERFMRFKNDGITVFSIVGNHDVNYDRLDTLERSALGIMFLSGAIKPLGTLRVERKESPDVIFNGIHWTEDIPDKSNTGNIEIALVHMFYGFGTKDSVEKSDVEKLGYRLWINSHDHAMYDTVTVETNTGISKIIRPGSFMRASAHNYQISRMVYVDMLDIKDNQGIKIERVELPVKKPEEVFSASVLDKIDTKSINNDISIRFNELISKIYSNNSNNSSIYTILDTSVKDKEVKLRITNYLEDRGIFRK